MYFSPTPSSQLLNLLKILLFDGALGFKKIAHKAGLKVSATKVEMSTATVIEIANSRYIMPVIPAKNDTGTNTAASTKEVATMAPESSVIACLVAATTSIFCSLISRSTLSTTTIASSTTMPIANTIANKLTLLMVKPNAAKAIKVPTIDTGTANAGIKVVRQFCKNKYTTKITKISA